MPQGRFLLLHRTGAFPPAHRTSNLKTKMCASLLTAISRSVLTSGKSSAMSARGLCRSQDRARGRSRRARRHLMHRRGWRDKGETEKSRAKSSGKLAFCVKKKKKKKKALSNGEAVLTLTTGALSLTLQHPATCNCSQDSSHLASIRRSSPIV